MEKHTIFKKLITLGVEQSKMYEKIEEAKELYTGADGTELWRRRLNKQQGVCDGIALALRELCNMSIDMYDAFI